MKKDKLLDFINYIKNTDKVTEERHKNVTDKYLNGNCEDLVGYLFEYNGYKGGCTEIEMIELDEYGDEIQRLFHSVFSYKGKFYDIQGVFDNIEDLIKKTPYYNEKLIIELYSWEIPTEYRGYKKIPKNIKYKNKLYRKMK